MTTPEPAAVRIVRGEPDEIELAALVASLAAAQPVEDETATEAHRWADPARHLRGAEPWRPGRDAWRWRLRG